MAAQPLARNRKPLGHHGREPGSGRLGQDEFGQIIARGELCALIPQGNDDRFEQFDGNGGLLASGCQGERQSFGGDFIVRVGDIHISAELDCAHAGEFRTHGFQMAGIAREGRGEATGLLRSIGGEMALTLEIKVRQLDAKSERLDLGARNVSGEIAGAGALSAIGALGGKQLRTVIRRSKGEGKFAALGVDCIRL